MENVTDNIPFGGFLKIRLCFFLLYVINLLRCEVSPLVGERRRYDLDCGLLHASEKSSSSELHMSSVAFRFA